MSLHALADKIATGWVHPADREKPEFSERWRSCAIDRAYYDRAPMRDGVGGMADAPDWYLEGREALGYDTRFVRSVVEAYRAETRLPSPAERDAHYAKADAGGTRVNGSPVREIGGPVTKPVTKPEVVTKPLGGRPAKGDRSMSDAERMRAYRERKAAAPHQSSSDK